jgi:hypothetical protein
MAMSSRVPLDAVKPVPSTQQVDRPAGAADPQGFGRRCRRQKIQEKKRSRRARSAHASPHELPPGPMAAQR